MQKTVPAPLMPKHIMALQFACGHKCWASREIKDLDNKLQTSAVNAAGEMWGTCNTHGVHAGGPDSISKLELLRQARNVSHALI